MKPRIIFAGTPAFAVPTLQALSRAGHAPAAVYTQPDRPAGRGQSIAFSPVKHYAVEHHLAVEQPVSMREPAAIERMREYRPDMLVVVAYGLILSPAVLEIPSLGSINVHASLLPRWRGAAPIQRAILAGDRETGVSIMRMEAGLDAGPVYSMRSVSIQEHETAQSLHDRLADIGAELLVETLDAVLEGRATARAQPPAGVTYAAKIDKEHARIDWNRSALDIDRAVRAFNPWPVAFTYWRNQPLRVWAAQVEVAAPAQDWYRPVGTVVQTSPRGAVVATGNGWLTLTQLQAPGRKAMATRDFLNAQPLAGEIFE